MKTIYLLIFSLFLSLNTSHISAQIFEITDAHSTARDSVVGYGIGDTLVIKYDSVYLFNETQVRYYQLLMKLKVSVTKDNKNLEKLFAELLKDITMNIAELEDLSKKMKANADAASEVGTRLADQTLKSVDKTNALLNTSKVFLDSADAKLTRADLHLAKAEEYIREAKKKQWWERLKWGGGGVLVGVILKSVFFKK